MAVLEQETVLTEALRPVPAGELEFSQSDGCSASRLGDGSG